MGLYLGAALHIGQRLNQGFLLLHDEGVLLRAGDGPNPRHHGLVELVPGAALHLGQQLTRVFHKLVLLLAGDGHEPLHLGLVGLVPRLVFLVEHGTISSFFFLISFLRVHSEMCK